MASTPETMQSLILIGNVVALGIVAVPVLMYRHSGKLIYQGTRGVKHDPSEHDWDYHEAYVDVPGGKTHLWYVPAEHETLRTILFSHGNAGNLGDKLQSIGIFRAMGFNVLAYDYGGYGNSSGSTHEARMVDDIRAVWRYAIDELHIPPEQMIIHGRSMGGGPSAYLATEVEAGAAVLESTFCSLTEIVKGRYAWMPSWIFGRNRFETLQRIGEVKSPLLVIHGREDTLIPFKHGHRLYTAAPEPKAFMEIHGEHHEGFWKYPDIYKRGLLDFINIHVPEQRG